MSENRPSEDYLSIAEYASITGLSKQAVYQRINRKVNALNKHIKRDGNKVYIAITALSEEQKQRYVDQRLNADSQRVGQRLNNVNQRDDEAIQLLKEQVEQLQKQLEEQNSRFKDMQQVLTGQLEQKDEQISALSGMIQAKDIQIQDLSDLLKANTAERLQLQAGKKSVFKRLLDSFKSNRNDTNG